MIIKKILNNNVIVTENEQHREIIAMGKGLCFQKKIGSEVEESKIDKIFELRNEEETNHFSRLLSEVPLEYFQWSEEFINYITAKLGKKLHPSIYITLTDHIHTLVERSRRNVYIINTMLWDIKRLYKEEFSASSRVVEKINEHLNSHFDENEAATIAMHIVNAELEVDFGTAVEITKVMAEVLNIVKYQLGIVYDEDSLAYYRFIIHLRFFAERIFMGTTYEDSNDKELFRFIKNKYAKAYKSAIAIHKYIEQQYHYKFSDEETMYLVIHIQKVAEDSAKI